MQANSCQKKTEACRNKANQTHPRREAEAPARLKISMPELHPGVGACGRRPLRVRRPRGSGARGGKGGRLKEQCLYIAVRGRWGAYGAGPGKLYWWSRAEGPHGLATCSFRSAGAEDLSKSPFRVRSGIFSSLIKVCSGVSRCSWAGLAWHCARFFGDVEGFSVSS